MLDFHYENEDICELRDYGNSLKLLRIPIILSLLEDSKQMVCNYYNYMNAIVHRNCAHTDL